MNRTEQKQEKIIYLERRFVHVNERDYANYFVKGNFNLRGQAVVKEIRMDIPRNDVGMYDVLDMVFEDREKVELCKIARVTTDLSTGKKNTTYRYEVRSEDKTLVARVVPASESNNALLDKLYKDLEKEPDVEEDDSTSTTE